MEPSIDTKEDPLIAALPPATDYMTYLTLLEYQLKPDNLSTLNKLLSDDDGTLAAEIGWDLLKLVLPMLQIVPEDANACLGIIARRGNPREVVVRVAEELERLGHEEEEEEEEEQDDEEVLDQDGLPTFAGEAPPIHLGELKLDGMPTPKEQTLKPASVEVERSDRHASITGEEGSDDHLILQALLNMLAIVHPRIKTQYPSRFLATSLPAALGSYRRATITTETTLAFLNFLAKMSGKQRPALPPRVSTQGNIPTTFTVQQSNMPSAPAAQAPPLPDPEAKTDPSSNNTQSLTSERAITRRLLQAVMLEVLDEYTGSFQSTPQPSMSWTIRLREKHEAKRVLPNRPTEAQRWTQSAELKQRDEMIARFLKLSKDLDLDIAKELGELIQPTASEGADEVDQPESDYPTSPSQIPFASSSLILLFAAQNFAQDMTGLSGTPPLPIDATRTLFKATFAPAQELPHLPSLSQTDALLSLIYTTLQSPLSQPQTTDSTLPVSTIDLPFLTNLTNLFTTSPDRLVRDSTHHLTTLLLHNHTTPEVKLLYIESLLSPSLTPASPVHEIQQGNLRAIAINWLKDEFLSYHTVAVAKASQTNIEAGTTEPPDQPPMAPTHQSPVNPGLNPNLMHTDPELVTLVFSELPTPPTPFITGHPGAAASASGIGGGGGGGTPPSLTSEPDLETLLLQIPSYIASLNLIPILASLPSSTADSENESVLASAGSNTDNKLLQHVTRFVATSSAWKDLLLGFAGGIAQAGKKAQGEEQGPLDISDVYALEDAVGRAKVAIEAL